MATKEDCLKVIFLAAYCQAVSHFVNEGYSYDEACKIAEQRLLKLTHSDDVWVRTDNECYR